MQRQKLEILTQIFGSYQKSGKEFLFNCPKCNHAKKKLSINLDKDVYKCWICDLKGSKLHRLVRKYGSVLNRSEWGEIFPIEIPSNLKEYFEDYYNTDIVPQKVQLPQEFQTLSEPSRSREYALARKYLHSRGLSDWDILYWKIGFCPSGPYGGRVVIPSFDSIGNINYFVSRAYKDFENKYKNPKVDKAKMIFNELYIDWTKDLVLVEGIFDAMKATNAVPLLGSTLGKQYKLFQEIIKHDTPIFIALDKDVVKKAFKLIEELNKYEIEVYKIDTSTIPTDIGDLTKQEFDILKEGAVLMTESEILRERMRNLYV